MVAADGTEQTVSTPEEYRAAVAKNRTAAGIPAEAGQPVPVNVSFEGGGGRGKRFKPAIDTMLSLGVVPASLSGSSAGSIAAGLLAAGATPQQLQDFLDAPALKKFLDFDVTHGDQGGVADGQVAFDDFDQTLRQLTGIKDRPVTFADLKIPLQVLATTAYDSKPPMGKTDLTKWQNRQFIFSQETTPNTPVALAIRASMSIPALYRPVEMLDPVSGRQVDLFDGGVINNIPMGLSQDGLPSVGLGLVQPEELNPAHYTQKQNPLPAGNLDVTHVAWNGLNCGSLLLNSGREKREFETLAHPDANQFMIALPVFNLDKPLSMDTVMGFADKPSLDNVLNPQTRGLVESFFKTNWAKLKDPTQRATNVPVLPVKTKPFQVGGIKVLGLTFTAKYQSGDSVEFSSGPVKFDVDMGAPDIRAVAIDDEAFGDLKGELTLALELHLVSLGILSKIPGSG